MTTFEVPTGHRVNITTGSLFLAFLDTGTREEMQQDVNYPVSCRHGWRSAATIH